MQFFCPWFGIIVWRGAWMRHGEMQEGVSKHWVLIHPLSNLIPSIWWAEEDYFPWCSSDTVSFLRPLARREANTLRPFLVAILSRKPCLFTLLLLWGWNVLFIACICFYVIIPRGNPHFWAAKLGNNLEITKNYAIFSAMFYVFFGKNLNFAPIFNEFQWMAGGIKPPSQ